MPDDRSLAAYVAGRRLVVALGGNALVRKGDPPTIGAQYLRAAEAMDVVADLVRAGASVVLTHGNGPVVGNIVLRGELAQDAVPPTPLYISDADSEGGIGLMLQQVLGNCLRKLPSPPTVATVVTQVVVDAHDPAFSRPTKPIGLYYSAEEARAVRDRRGWELAEEPGRGWRRVVPSPRPLRVVETPAVRALADAGIVAIAGGGGGVPVVERDGVLEGVDAVVDKDWTSAVLAAELVADTLLILMEADAVYAGWGTPESHALRTLSAKQASSLAEDGAFAGGSVRPKVEAAAWFASRTGRSAVICRAEDVRAALAGDAGTTIEAP